MPQPVESSRTIESEKTNDCGFGDQLPHLTIIFSLEFKKN